MTHLAFIDTETIGLDMAQHPIWELALIIEGHPDAWRNGEYVWEFPVDLSKADPMALKIGRFYERSQVWARAGDVGTRHVIEKSAVQYSNDPNKRQLHNLSELRHTPDVLHAVVDLLNGAHLVGAVPDFDAYRLRLLLKEWGFIPSWHYHLVDVEAMMVGYLSRMCRRVDLPWNSKELTADIGVTLPSTEEEHTALGDARWARRVYHHIVNVEVPF